MNHTLHEAERIAAVSQTGMLTFKLGAEHYAIDILKVQEIRGYETVTRIANAPAAVKGVINLRGNIVPIIDMRIRFNLPQSTYDDFTVVIIVNVGARVVGMVVDGVSDVVSLSPDQIQPGPTMAAINQSCITGLGTLDDRMLILLDVHALLADMDSA
ncbi:chemotaxis protein CheW [Pseudomonas sp.]|uniref:chemotaxis protein CheW n=1 Tax=Pseudomonas sp. TaxID=306 RepID=UPI0025D3CBBA|nr:chemotaxis protein CheW [Pseudomonas sp.]